MLKIGKKDFNKFLDKFIVLAEKDLQTTKLLLQKGDTKTCIKYVHTVNLDDLFLIYN